MRSPPNKSIKTPWGAYQDLVLAKKLSDDDNPPYTGSRLRKVIPWFKPWSPKTLTNKIRSIREKLRKTDRTWPTDADLARIDLAKVFQDVAAAKPSPMPLALSSFRRQNLSESSTPPPSYSSNKSRPTPSAQPSLPMASFDNSDEDSDQTIDMENADPKHRSITAATK
ncbi:hypothetical protein BC829DRAFT_415678 [Chytridium lagenaria]|nr:hypothetical protein BC829DRAFT_415678 [Chytridium lagenaria]